VNVKLPEVSLVGIGGESASLSEALNSGAPVILNFIFTTCTTICPVMTATFQQVQKQLGPKRSNARMVSVSIDPENDTPATLKAYATKFGAGPQWKMLTGNLENSIAVQKAFGVFAGDKMNHKPVTFLKAKGSDNSWVRLDGLLEARQIIKEFDKLNAK
jgi:protein SCO1/2